jgi:hypothetical protein
MSCKPVAERRPCACDMPDFYPMAARVAAMIDGDNHAGDLAIVCADCHDPLEEQQEVLIMRKLLAAMHADGKMLALTVCGRRKVTRCGTSAPRCNAAGRGGMRSRCDPRHQASTGCRGSHGPLLA